MVLKKIGTRIKNAPKRWSKRLGIGKSNGTSKVAKTAKDTAKKTSQWKKPDTKTLLQAGALLTGAMDRGSSKGVAGSIIKADQSDFFGEQNTDDASGKQDYSRLDK